MSTETELVLSSMTDEELDDGLRWLAFVHDQWLAHVARRETDRSDDGFGHGTDGPTHMIRALDLAIVRERAIRGGAPEWYVGMPTADHPARAYIEHYQKRVTLDPDNGIRPRLAAAGIVEKVCLGCGEPKPLTVASWAFLGGSLDDWCRPCRAGQGPTASEPIVVDVDPLAAL